jgi:hypothetical protein
MGLFGGGWIRSSDEACESKQSKGIHMMVNENTHNSERMIGDFINKDKNTEYQQTTGLGCLETHQTRR